jgi:hypothetical protein
MITPDDKMKIFGNFTAQKCPDERQHFLPDDKFFPQMILLAPDDNISSQMITFRLTC